MKKIALLLLLCASSAFAQEKKYQSLLWEVSGNGLTKKSYLYGSMHVSDKVSYHLSDAFFTHLLNADIVANESEPSTWTDLFGMFMPNYGQYQPQFYAGFYQKPVTKSDLYPLFRSNNFTLNNLLFRTNEYNKEYQEETYLDMFIYRTGRKYNKKTVGLEDTKKSILGIINADLTDKPKEENRIAVQKILKNNGYDEALMNFYRDKDLDMIDSLTTLSTSENYLKAMLYDRNIVMVNSIDSLARQGSLFAAIGAAHLPGKKGVIEMLRAKGYTVTPVFDTYTDKGKAKKQQIEEYFSKPALKRTGTPDGMIELPLYTSIIENYENIESPDLANGGYINVKRLLLRDYLKKDNKPFDHKSLDSLFYENIPGNIIDKKFYTQDGYSIYDIKNITKTGNTQHYRYYITPLEIITVTMSGEGNYVRQFENEVYNSISLKPISAAWKTITPKRGGFSAELPEYTVVYGDREKATNVADIEMYSYDSKEKSNYFIVERTLHDKTLEDTKFELKRIHYQFYNQFDIDSTQTKLSGGNPLSFTSSSKIGNKTISLKTVINGSKYYLLGSVGASEANTQRFFNSFAFKPNSSTEEFRTFTDSTSHFTVQIPKRQNEKLDFAVKRDRMYFDEDEKVNTFSEKFKEHEFTLPSGETVDITFYQYHRYETRKEPDSLWKSFRQMITGRDEDKSVSDQAATEDIAVPVVVETVGGYSDFETKKGITSSTWSKYIDNSRSKRKIKLLNEKISYNEGKKYHQIDVLAVDDKSEQAIKYRGIYRDGASYVLSAMVNKNYKNNDPYLEKIFDSFTLLEHKTETLTQDNLELFIQDAQSEHDSIRFSAFASIHEVKVTEKNAQKLIDFIKGYNFKATETNSLVSLYRKLGLIKHPGVIPFLEQQYKQDNSNTIIQFAVLNALTLQESKEAYKKIMELLEYDLPLSDGAYEVRSLFGSFEEDTDNSEVLFPDILQFYSIQEYHQPIVDFTAKLLDDKSIRPGKLNSYKKMILTNARLELKRVKSRKANQEAEEDSVDYYDDYDYYEDYSQSEDLIGYLNILYPYRNDKKVQPFFTDCKALGMSDIDLELARLDITHKNIVKQDIEKLLKKPETRYIVHNMLLTAKENGISKLTDLEIAESALITEGNVKPSKVNIEFIEQKAVKHGNHNINFYFFKLHAKNTDTYMGKNERITAIAFITKDEKIDALAYKFIEPVSIADEEDNKETMEAMIDQALNEYNSRVSFGKMEANYNDILMEEYGDY